MRHTSAFHHVESFKGTAVTVVLWILFKKKAKAQSSFLVILQKTEGKIAKIASFAFEYLFSEKVS